MISRKQREANRRNAQRSTGPKTQAGKEAVRFNALQHGLRARCLLITGEKPEEFAELYAALESEWQPQTRTEQIHVEQMAVHQWLLARLTGIECGIFHRTDLLAREHLDLLDRLSTQRNRLERAFSHTMRDLERLQQTRPEPAEEEDEPASPEHPQSYPESTQAPPAPYLMSEANTDAP